MGHLSGMHPDVIFAQSGPELPYVTATQKYRDAHPGTRARSRDRRLALLANPEKYDLTEEEIAAIAAMDQRQ